MIKRYEDAQDALMACQPDYEEEIIEALQAVMPVLDDMTVRELQDALSNEIRIRAELPEDQRREDPFSADEAAAAMRLADLIYWSIPRRKGM